MQNEPQERMSAPFEQAAVNMPNDEPQGAEAGNLEGQSLLTEEASPKLPTPIEEKAPLLPAVNLPAYPETSPFWHTVLETGRYTNTPLVGPENIQHVQTLIEDLDRYLRGAGYEVERHELQIFFHGRVMKAVQEYEHLRREMEPQRQQLEKELHRVEEQIRAVEEEFAQKFAEARLPVPHEEQPKKKRKKKPEPPPAPLITPEYVERALREDFARPEEIAGEQGVTPPRDKGGFLNSLYPVGQWLLEFFAPLFAGLILGINIGVITGLLSLTDLTQLANPVMVLIAALVGMFIEKLVGNGYYHVASTISNASERRGDVPSADREIPRLKVLFALVFLAPMLLLVSIAMVTVDGLGLRMLHEEAIRNAQLGGTAVGEVLPLWVYLIAGAIISLPYLLYKAVMGWRSAEVRQREAYLSYLSWKHIEERRNDPTVKQVFGLAGRLSALRNQHAQIIQNLLQIKARLDSARTAAVGIHEEFNQYMQGLIERLKAERDGALNGSYRNGKVPRPSQQQTFLSRLMSLLRGR